MMKAKMKVSEVKQYEGREDITFNAVCKSGSYPAGGNDEDNTFALFTPSAELKMSINNPALHGKIKPGQKFYVDFTLAE